MRKVTLKFKRIGKTELDLADKLREFGYIVTLILKG